MSARAAPERFATIDALRGVAAICVMLYHAQLGGILAMPGGYLAVDLFFALSGFIIAHSYGARIENGLGFNTFMRLRAARLWPMLILGALLGMGLHGGHPGMLFLLPNPKSPDMLFPANPPFWSLLLEMIAYAAFALLWTRVRRRALLGIIGASAAVLAIASIGSTGVESFGAGWSTVIEGLARLGFAFSIGVAIWSVRQRWPVLRKPSIAAWLIPLAFVLISAFVPRNNMAVIAVCLFAVPALVWCATRWEVPDHRLSAALGDLSYPLYCIHAPLIASAAVLGWKEPLALALPAIALALDRLVDTHARSALKRILTARTAPKSAAVA